MSAPRQILPGTTYLITRRCAQRQFLLRPDSKVNTIFRFCLAHAASRFAIQVHGYIALSNHFHLVITDTKGKLPAFMHWLNEYVAKCVNAHRGRWEAFWAPGSYSAVRLADAEDVLAKMVYLFTNPVAAGLVRRARQWPGARSLPEDLNQSPLCVPRPRGFFRDDGPVPESAELRLCVPDLLEASGGDPVRQLEQAVKQHEEELALAVRSEGRSFLGPRRVRAQSPWQRPRTREPRRQLNPRVAAVDKWRRIEVLQRLKSFLTAYREAWQQFVEGDQLVEFPKGTYWMRLRLGVRCGGT
jgi:REP element-mobilizing transposase RayT